MYALLWRVLPGRWPAKVIWCTALLAGVLALLFYVVFPWAEPHLPWNHVTVTGTTPAPATTHGP